MALKPICRLGDFASGTCTAHSPARLWTGVIDTVSGGFDISGVQGAVRTDSGLANCNHRFVIITSSSISKNAAGNGLARVDDLVQMVFPGSGTGVLVTGSDIAFTD